MNAHAPVILDSIRSRRSIRRYQNTPVPRVMLETMLEAARWAPSAHNRQPWRFAVVESASTRHALASVLGARLRADLERDQVPRELLETDVARSYARLTGAPAIIAVCMTMGEMDTYADAPRRHAEWTMATQSVAMAAQNLLLAAHALGLGACWLCAPLFVPDVVGKVLSLPADWQPHGLITLGYAAETRTKTRKPLSDVLRYVNAPEGDKSS